MSRFFSSSARALVRFLGFDVKKLPAPFDSAVATFTAPGGSAEQKLGKLEEVYIKSRDGNPVHKSHYNPKDKELGLRIGSIEYSNNKTPDWLAEQRGWTPAEQEAYRRDLDLKSTMNIGPQGLLVDCHIDLGTLGLSTTAAGSAKLWALWPPSEHNLRVFKQIEHGRPSPASEDWLLVIRAVDELRDGRFTVTRDKECILLPPGTIHAVYTLRGGVVAGVEFADRGCLNSTAWSWDVDYDVATERARQTGEPVRSGDAADFFFQSVWRCKAFGSAGEAENVLSLMCQRLHRIPSLSATARGAAERIFGETRSPCPICGMLLRDHYKDRRDGTNVL